MTNMNRGARVAPDDVVRPFSARPAASMATLPNKFDTARSKQLLANNRTARIELATCNVHDPDAVDRRSDSALVAEEAVLLMPFPDVAALAAKLELIAVSDDQPDCNILNGLVSHALRLPSMDRGPTLVPKVWLRYFRRSGGRMFRRDGRYGSPPLLIVARAAPQGPGSVAARRRC